MKYTIRKIKPSEYSLLETFLYEAIFQRDENNLLPSDIIYKPELYVYIKDFGKSSDHCLVAEYKNEIIACVWTRIITGEIRGYGNIDDETPEFSISVLKSYRGLGLGTALMRSMLKLLKENRYKKTSLAVQKDNYALNMYKDLGFKIINETEEEFIMIYYL